jgi:hypothetical protein
MREMQRWIIISVVAMMLVLGGGGFGYWKYRQNRPYPVWVPMPINPEFSLQQRTDTAKELRQKLGKKEILIQVSKDLGLPNKLGVASDEAAADELAKRLFVDAGQMESPKGVVYTLNIGFTGVKKDKTLTEEMSMRLMEDVWKILGIKPPPKK